MRASLDIRFSKAGGIFHKLTVSLFLLAFLVGGALMTRQFWSSLGPRVASFSWSETECTIEASGTTDAGREGKSDERYRFDVRYRYRVDGESFVGNTYRIGYRGSDDVSATEALVSEMPPGSRVPCWFDAAQPASSALVRGRLSNLLLLAFPLVFVVTPILALFFTWRRRKEDPESPQGQTTESISRSARAKMSPGCLIGFFALFTLFGFGFLIPFFILPTIKVVAARSWIELPCEILESGVQTHSGDDSDTYSVEILYRYEVDGREYRSSRYEFMGGSSSLYERKHEIVAGLPPGTSTVCYVDPDAHHQAVIERGMTREFLFGLIPLVFVLVGVGGGFVTYRFRSRSTSPHSAPKPAMSWLPKRRRRSRPTIGSTSSWASTSGTLTGDSGFGHEGAFGISQSLANKAYYGAQEGPIELEASMGAKGRFFATLFVALFWNGIVSLFVWRLVADWQDTGSIGGCLMLFLVPFVLVGLALLVAVPHQFLALANPRPILTLSRGAVPIGESTRLSWRFEGAAHRLHRLEIKLIGEEVARYRRGTDTHTSRSRFAELSLLSQGQGGLVSQGVTELTIPPDTMHSFDAPNNKIEWKLTLHGSIRMWPDVTTEFPFTVLPNQEEPP